MSRCAPHLRAGAGITSSRLAPSRVTTLSQMADDLVKDVETAGGRQLGGKGVYAFAGLGCTRGFFGSVGEAGGTMMKR